MCGIVAVVHQHGSENAIKVGNLALNTLINRGPDDGGWVVVGNEQQYYLGHRRLSILDLSSKGHQPMICPHSGNTMIFNGEIYNFIELKKDLESLGIYFETNTDSEVVLQAYRVWGIEAFSRFNGMWAVVIHDKISDKLIVSRDRLGVKPLYFCSNGELVVFASEIKAIAGALGGYPAPNKKAIFDFLMLGLSDHQPYTFYDGIQSVSPGWIFILDQFGRISREQINFWESNLPEDQLDPYRLHDLMVDSVRLRMRSDAATVSLLSSGLDSSIVTSIAAQSSTVDERTNFSGAFSYGYSDQNGQIHDEVELATNFYKTLDSETQHFIYRAQSTPTEKDLYDLMSTQDEPFCTPSIIASYRIYQAIKEGGFKVALVGEGSDELFGGYVTRYMSLLARDYICRLDFSAAASLLMSGAAKPTLVINRLMWNLPRNILISALGKFRPNVQVMNKKFIRSMIGQMKYLQGLQRMSAESRVRSDVLQSNLPMILRFTDRNSMRHGIEARSPFLDYRIVSLALRTSLMKKMGSLQGKQILRDAFYGLLPRWITENKKTFGFGNAEQFNFNSIKFESLINRAPKFAGKYLNLEQLEREMAKNNPHPSLWWPICILLWLGFIYGDND